MNVTGTTGNETLNGTSTDDVIDGLGGNDTINGLTGNDSMNGGDGDDLLVGGSGNDTLNGGVGFDSVSYATTANDGGTKQPTGQGVTVNLKTGVATDNWGDTDTLVAIETVTGSPYDDVLTGGNPTNGSGTTDGYEGFRGLAGNDTIDGGTGFDRAFYDNSPAAVVVTLGGQGNGTASDGFGGTDTLINIEEVRGSAFNDTLTGSDDATLFESFEGRAGNDAIDGKAGANRANYSSSPAAVNVNLATGTAQDGWGGTDMLINITEIGGSAYNDVLVGNAGANFLAGMGGDDTMDGGDGFDWMLYHNATGNVVVNLATGMATGAAGNDTFTNIEAVRGSAYADSLTGNAANNAFRGDGGDDVIDGGAGTDTAIYTTTRGTHTVTKTSTGFTVASTTASTDTLSNIERLYFSDVRLAYDIAGVAGTAAQLMGAVTGKASLQDKALVGAVIGLLDGGMSAEALATLVINNGVVGTLAGGTDSASVVKLLLRNVLGSDTNTALVDTLTGMIASGAQTQVSLLMLAAGLDINKTNIDLVGLAQTGLQYTSAA